MYINDFCNGADEGRERGRVERREHRTRALELLQVLIWSDTSGGELLVFDK
jgi:hypothetical protein